jgi:DNA polymerase I-like protein with 3'-5' exonuclease and polymerase domains
MEHRGIPIDIITLHRLQHDWQELQERLVIEIDADYNVYNGLTFKTAEFERYLSEKDIPWPRTETGRLSLSDDVFKDMTKTYPFLQGLKDLRHMLGAMKLNALAVGADGRNRTMLSPFRSKTGRNQPSSAKYIFGPAVWLRSLIRPEPGKALVYADYAQQEFAIAGYLSGDSAMQEAYRSGDPYLSFAKMAGAAPHDATKESHKAVRDLYKICALGVQFGMGEQSLARQMNRPPAYAGELLRQHRRVFKTYWDWSDRVLNDALLTRRMTTSFGWQFHIAGDGGDASRSIRNWQMQSTGADILRMASVLLERNEIEVVGPVHDAVLLECSMDDADNVAKKAAAILEQASAYVLGERRVVRVEYDIICYPDRYTDPRGVETWNRVNRLLDEIDTETCTS